ncbi:MAG TPA: ammonia channel protein, partial [Pseudonocardia sp.]|nr:ammonia channel protein [Pseudonocardia sp.]
MPFDFETVDTGATAWVLASAALVLLMTPGLAFFYSGMVRAKHALGMLMQNYVTIAIVSLVWVLVGFSLAFGAGNGFIGDLHFAGLQNIGDTIPGYVDSFAQVIPPMVFVVFQLMFAVITPALITGSTADRWKFGAFVPFIALWSILVYSPVAHWVFSPAGWLFRRGALDFAGGTVVHINAGIAALAADGIAAQAFMNTNMAAAAAMLSWLLVERIKGGHATTLGAASGAVAGLVAITPCAGFVGGMAPIYIGLV